MLRLEQLDYLRMVVRCNSIKVAAETLNVVPSTVSTALHKLENEIGVPLLLRTYRGIEVTDVAREIAEKAEEIFGTVREIDDIVYQYKQLEKNHVPSDTAFTIYLSRGYYQGTLGYILEQCESLGFQVDCPDLSRGNETYLEKVNEDENSILINFFAEPAGKLIEQYGNVEYYRLYSSKPAVICSRKSKFISSGIKEITIEEALQLPYLMFTEGYDLALPIYEMLEQYGTLNIISKYANMAVMQTMLERGKGAAVTCEKGMLRQAKTMVGNMWDDSMCVIPIKCDMKISLMLCFNKKIKREKRMLLDKLVPLFL